MSEEAALPANIASRGASPFGRGAVLAILVVGFAAFLAMLYFISASDTGGESSNRNAHASSNALHGFAGLVSLLDANGYEVEKSRLASGMETSGLLVLTPPINADPEQIGELLDNRQYAGPTLVILPKWMVGRPQGKIADEDEGRVRDDWVQLLSALPADWMSQLDGPYTLDLSVAEQSAEQAAQEGAAQSPQSSGTLWSGMGRNGVLPDPRVVHAEQGPDHEAIVTDQNGRALAVNVIGQEGTYFYDEAHFLTIVIEPDLMNNYGLADPDRAALALAIIKQAGYDERQVTFDMTLVGIGGSTNLLTLAFQPPFLAATLCLIIAMLIVGWRAFLRFGPVAAQTREVSFGKSQLVKNGARLILRARRLKLLAAPYVALHERRIGRALGLAKPDDESIDLALRQRHPDEEPFSNRAAHLLNANGAGEIVRAAQSLNDLGSKTTGKSPK